MIGALSYLRLVREFCWVIVFLKNLEKTWLNFQFLVHWWNNSDHKSICSRNLTNEKKLGETPQKKEKFLQFYLHIRNEKKQQIGEYISGTC